MVEDTVCKLAIVGDPIGTETANRSDTAKGREDLLLLALIEQGDESAMARLYDCHSRVVYSVAVRVLRDPAAAEDVLQDVFMKLWRKPSSFIATRGTLSGWLAVTTRNRCIDVLRTRRPTDSIEDIPLQSSGNHSGEVELGLMMERIRMLIKKLPVVQQRALELAFFKEWTHAEVAAHTHVPLGTIKTRIRAALQMLKRTLDIRGSAAFPGSYAFKGTPTHALPALPSLLATESNSRCQ